MHKSDAPVLRDVVLVGGGHSHVVALRDFAMRPLSGVRLTLVSSDVLTPYSGMLPGYVAGHYRFDEVHIDLCRLAQSAGARFIAAEAVGLDRTAQRVLLRARPALAYDLVSLDIGSTPALDAVPGAARFASPVKPIAEFNQRWLGLLARSRASTGIASIAVVGAGAGGVELLLAMQYRLRQELHAAGRSRELPVFHLFCAGETVLPGHPRSVQLHFERVLRAREVRVHLAAPVDEVAERRVHSASTGWVQADEIVWVTQAAGAGWLRETGLALDAAGFVRVDDCLRSPDDAHVFAAGDVASMSSRALPKAGVFAVRMGPALAANLRRALQGRPLRPYRAQRRWLSLVSTGDRHAVASRGSLSLSGRWVWRWKDRIDRRFMQRYTQFPTMPAAAAQSAAPVADLVLTSPEALQARSALAMRCGGCGAKVGATLLTRALAGLQPIGRDEVLIGLDAADDAAVVRVPPGMAMVHSVDFFRAFIDDPYLFGRIAANHALGDLFAMGAEPLSATAIVTVPPGLDEKVQELLRQLMGGAVEVLNEAGCALVGGHTGEGAELALGFAVNGTIAADGRAALRKGGLRVGDAIVLAKPLGTGTLFAAHARGQAQGRWIQQALAQMQVSNRAAGECLRAHGARACTDVTGFGLLGHLLELVQASNVGARIALSTVPLLEGAQECVAAGLTSSLQGANLGAASAIGNAAAFAQHPRYALLFDPQTAGGLLAGVASEQADACVAALRAAGYRHACQIGRVAAREEGKPRLLLEA